MHYSVTYILLCGTSLSWTEPPRNETPQITDNDSWYSKWKSTELLQFLFFLRTKKTPHPPYRWPPHTTEGLVDLFILKPIKRLWNSIYASVTIYPEKWNYTARVRVRVSERLGLNIYVDISIVQGATAYKSSLNVAE